MNATSHRTPPWAIVAKREMFVQLTDKTFWIGTLTTIGLMIAAVGFSFLMQAGDGSPSLIAVDSDDAAGVVALANAQGQNVESVRYETAELESAVESGDVEGALHRGDAGWEMLLKPSMGASPTLDGAVRDYQLEQNATALGVDARQLTADTVLTLRPVGAESGDVPAIIIATLAFAILFMFSALTYGYMIANSVVTEKESRIVEILAATIPTRQLLIGKVIGNTALALGQVLLFVAVALVGLSLTEYRSFIGLIAPVTGWFVLFFLVGFAALACLWAAAGAMATRVQDVQQTTTPLMIIIMGVYFAGFIATGRVQEILSYVPIASTVVMPGRLLSGDASWIDAGLALLVAVAFMALAIWFGERIYRRGLLQTGSVMSFREAVTGRM